MSLETIAEKTFLSSVVSNKADNKKEYSEYHILPLDFSTIFNDSGSSDVVLFGDDESKPIYCHRCILSSRSQKLGELLGFERNKERIVLKGHSYDVVYQFLRYIYTGSCHLTKEIWRPLLPLAEEFQLPLLKSICFAEMMKQVNTSSVISLLLKAMNGQELYYDSTFIKECVSVVARNPREALSKKGFLKLNTEIITILVQNPDLQINEDELLQRIIDWGTYQAKQQNKTLQEILVPDVMQWIRYPLIPMEKLFEARNIGCIPEKEWIETLELLTCNDELPPKYNYRIHASSNFKWSNGKKEISVVNVDWQMYLGSQIKNGRAKWTIKLKSMISTGNTWNLIIGVCKPNHPLQTYLGEGLDGWGYIAGLGFKNRDSASGVPYGQPFAAGDTITCILDLTAKTLEFLKNGKSQGVAFTDVDGPVCIAFSSTCNCTLQLI